MDDGEAVFSVTGWLDGVALVEYVAVDYCHRAKATDCESVLISVAKRSTTKKGRGIC